MLVHSLDARTPLAYFIMVGLPSKGHLVGNNGETVTATGVARPTEGTTAEMYHRLSTGTTVVGSTECWYIPCKAASPLSTFLAHHVTDAGLLRSFERMSLRACIF